MKEKLDNCLIIAQIMVDIAKSHKSKKKIRMTKKQRRELRKKEHLELINQILKDLE